MTRHLGLLLVAAVLAAVLAGCGRVGPIASPGPPERITYPRLYPAPDRVPPPVVALPPR